MSETPQRLKIGDKRQWAFFNGDWEDAADGGLQVPEAIVRQDGPGMQGHHYAFFKDTAYLDLRASFQFRLTPHSNVGLIFRAGDAGHFYVLHFPNCGQASRAQHFWAGLSKMDASGYFRIISLALINRVPSNANLWLDADVAVAGNTVTAHIGSHGHFTTTVAPCPAPGRVGIFQFGDAAMRNLTIEGNPTQVGLWNDTVWPRSNLMTPFAPSSGFHGLVRTAGGELLITHSFSADDNVTRTTFFDSRSADNGRTWSEPQSIEEPIHLGFNPKFKFTPTNIGLLHRSPGGPLLKTYAGKGAGEFCISESKDDGHTWLDPYKWVRADGRSGWMMGDPILDLHDGAMLTFSCGGYEPLNQGLDVWTWGSLHFQAFAYRSTDGGRTWSEPVNIDGTSSLGPDGQPSESHIEGNMDLTETSAVQMPDGSILALIRSGYSPWMWETSSDDGGRTWQPCVRGPFAGYNTSNLLRTECGAILVGHRLPELTIHISRDDGDTWDQGTTIDSGVGAGGRMIEVEPNVVLYVYFASWGTLRAQIFRVTPAGLEPAMT